jgi:cytidylate kinase
MIITIDGPVATGKSTIAKKLASEIGYIYFDTGAMYRSVTYAALKNNVNVDNPEDLRQFLDTFQFEQKIKRGERSYFVYGQDVSNEIRLSEVTSNVSRISACPLVREKMVALQKQMAHGVNAVFEGRDMGTVVFPDAQVKIFLTGRPEVRAKRRFDELKAKFPQAYENLTLGQALDDVNKRDELDTNREVSPLKQAPDALVIDTSDLSIDEIIMKILEFKDSWKNRQKMK